MVVGWNQLDTPEISYHQSALVGSSGHSMAYDAAHGEVVLFGGFVNADNPYSLDDTWLWDGANWTQQFPQTSPPARSDYGMTYDSVHSQVVIFGGQGSTNGVLGDTWTWDGANWTQEFPKNTPPARFGGALAYDSGHGQSILFGGLSYSQNPLGNIWADTWRQGWRQLDTEGPSNQPSRAVRRPRGV